FTMPYPEKTYRYTMVRDDEAKESFAEAGFNENGVAVTATVSTGAKSEVKTADPFIDTGITEEDLGTVLLSQSTSAKNAIEILAGILD
ncbi:MAG: C69 family dipeptidase, partial [Erysipelotrichaceae bacterium]